MILDAAVLATLGAGAAVGAVKAITTTREIAKGFASLNGGVQRIRRNKGDMLQGRALLGFRPHQNVAYRHDNVHALYQGKRKIHPDNLHALYAASYDWYRFDPNAAITVGGRLSGSIDDNLVLIGSAISEGLSRLIFGYRSTEEADSLTLTDAPLDLPFQLVLDRSQIAPGATAQRYVQGRGATMRPNWRIESSTGLYIPEVDSDGWLTTDYLLITRVRNFLTADGLDGGRWIVSLGGTHGTATRASELLSRNNAMLRAISVATKGNHDTSFQALFRISGIEHDARKGSRGRSIELVEEGFKTLDDRPSRWRAAQLSVQQGIRDWQTNSPQPGDHPR